MIDKDAIQLLLDTGKDQNAPDLNLSGDPYYITPQGELRSLASVYPPRRIKQTVNLTDSGSFIEYVNRFKTDNTLIFAKVDETSATLTAVLDYHKPTEAKPDYCHHRATFTTLPTPEWLTWMKANRQPMDQVTFANWLEDNLSLFVQPKDENGVPDVTIPSGADLLELVQTLHGTANARFSSCVRLHNGGFIEAYLAQCGVTGISKQYGPGGIPMALFFHIELSPTERYTVRLPAKVDEVQQFFWKEYVGSTKRPRKTKEDFREQALRTAWKIQQDWVQVQMSLIKLKQVDFLQVFMGFLWDGQRSYYESLQIGNFKALPQSTK